jgi:hypothetical protein
VIYVRSEVECPFIEILYAMMIIVYDGNSLMDFRVCGILMRLYFRRDDSDDRTRGVQPDRPLVPCHSVTGQISSSNITPLFYQRESGQFLI